MKYIRTFEKWPHYVYLYRNSSQEIIYIGITYDIKTRDRAHRRGKFADLIDSREEILCVNRKEAAALEKQLILEYKPPFNKYYLTPNGNSLQHRLS